MNEKKYLPSFCKEYGEYGNIEINLNIDQFHELMKGLKDSPALYKNKKGEQVLKLTLSKKKEKGQYGDTHYIVVNEFKPEQKADEKPKNARKELDDDLPF